jgi:hypothetical protein
MAIVQSDKQQRDAFAQHCNTKFIEQLVTAWREGNRLLVRSIIAECRSPSLGYKWQNEVADALTIEESQEFNQFIGG